MAYHSSVTVDTKTAVERGSLSSIKKGDVKLRTAGMDEAGASRTTNQAFDEALKAMQLHPRIVPGEITSNGSGPETHVSPYFTGQLERAIFDKAADRIKQFGKDGVVTTSALADINAASVQEDLKARAAILDAAAARKAARGISLAGVTTTPDDVGNSPTKVNPAQQAEPRR